jgi:hypothetical protein
MGWIKLENGDYIESEDWDRIKLDNGNESSASAVIPFPICSAISLQENRSSASCSIPLPICSAESMQKNIAVVACSIPLPLSSAESHQENTSWAEAIVPIPICHAELNNIVESAFEIAVSIFRYRIKWSLVSYSVEIRNIVMNANRCLSTMSNEIIEGQMKIGDTKIVVSKAWVEK